MVCAAVGRGLENAMRNEGGFLSFFPGAFCLLVPVGARARLSPSGVALTAMDKGHSDGQLQPRLVSTMMEGRMGELEDGRESAPRKTSWRRRHLDLS